MPLMQKRHTPSAKNSFGLLPEPLYYNLVQIVIWCECMSFQGFLKWSKDIKIAWWCVQFGQYGDGQWHAAWWCHQWVYLKSFSWSWYAATEADDNNSWHLLCRYMMGLLMSKNTVNITLPVGACDLNFFIQSTVRCFHCMPAGFPFGSKWQNHISLPITIHHREASSALLSLHMFQQYQDSLLFVYVSVDMGLIGNTPCDIPYPLELHAHF